MGNGQRILVIDDDDDTLEALQLWLATEGFEADGAESRDKAVEIIAQRPPDLILMDYSMPGMSADEFLKQCVSHCPQAKLALFTGAEDVEIGSLLGVPVILKKPVEMDQLTRFLTST